jgi:Helix-turn-helix.
MDFCSYVKSLPNERQEVITQLARLCRVTNTTVYRWISGDFIPDALKRKVIAEFLGKTEKDLWPNV